MQPDFLWMGLAPLILIHIVYCFALKKKDFSLIDGAWGIGFILISLIGIYLNQFHFPRENLMCGLVLLWGLRLSLFIIKRNSGKPEDFRYQAWRKDWGSKANVMAYFKVYLLQWILMLIIALPLFSVHGGEERESNFLDQLGLLVFLMGFLFETVADFQKSQFKKEFPEQICQVGLWKYSRHPNYFGECLVWWGICLISLNSGIFWGLIGATSLNFLLLKVSGVPLIEKKYLGNPAYEQYKRKTPRMIPFTKVKK